MYYIFIAFVIATQGCFTNNITIDNKSDYLAPFYVQSALAKCLHHHVINAEHIIH